MINIESDALNYLRKNNYVVVLNVVNTNLCWGINPSKTPWIEVKSAFTNDGNYHLYEYENIVIYVNKALRIDNNAVIRLNNKSSILGNKLCFHGIYLNKNLWLSTIRPYFFLTSSYALFSSRFNIN